MRTWLWAALVAAAGVCLFAQSCARVQQPRSLDAAHGRDEGSFNSDLDFRRVPAGYVTDWLVLGPFRKGEGQCFETAFADEKTAAPMRHEEAAGKVWRHAESTGRVLDLGGLFEATENAVVYAHVYVESDDAQRVQLRFGSGGGAAIWHNGKLIYRSDVPRPLTVDENSVDVMLTKGRNRFLFKVDEISGGWALSARLVAPDGQPLKGVYCHVYPPEDPAGPRRVSRGDVLHVDFGKAAPRPINVRVDDEGFIKLDRIGRIEAAGKTTFEIEEDILLLLPGAGMGGLQPVVSTLSLAYFIDGEVRFPGKKQFVRHTTLYRAIVDAGGFTEYADKTRVRILRSSPDGAVKTLAFNVEHIENEEEPDSEVIRPDDTIHVPRKR
ncbi:MAG: polysaccharide biosynthesis/export family protein [Verrucomicrobia bacterium]|nr:polysaccharide biosynthesis/export family protein [Verrucomicrobiota bacterium]